MDAAKRPPHLRPMRRRASDAAACESVLRPFFFSVSHRLGIDLGRFALNRADLRPLGPYQAKSLIQAEIQRLLWAISIHNSLFFIFFFFASLSSSSPDLTPFFFFFFASSSSSLLRLLEWVLFCFFFSFFFWRVLFLLIRTT